MRVADFSAHVSGPTASLLLRAVGAEVVKVENPRHGDGNRFMAASPQIGGASIYHHALNWGAKSVVADPKSDEWPAWVAGMAQWADVVIVGGRPTDVRRLGLDRESVAAASATAIHCHISGYGTTGPWSERAAHGQNPDALAGLFDIAYDDDGSPHPLPWRSAGTTMAGVMGALGVLAALWHRAESGAVLAVETSLWESAVWWNWRQLTSVANVGEDWGPVRDFGSRYSTYGTADGRPLLIAPVEEKFWQTFCHIAGLDELAAVGDWSTRYDFGRPEEHPVVAAAVRAQPMDWWIANLEPTGVPFCEVLSPDDVLKAPHFAEREMLVDLEDGGSVLRPPVRLASSEGTEVPLPHRRLPGLGEDTEEFRALLGL